MLRRIHVGRKERTPALVLKNRLLNSFVAPSEGSTGWVAAERSEESTRWTAETVSDAGALLLSSPTYARCAIYWPGASSAEATIEIPKVVFSESLTSAEWGETTIGTAIRPKPSPSSSRSSGAYLLIQGEPRFAGRWSRPAWLARRCAGS